jgi:hypothetical protein
VTAARPHRSPCLIRSTRMGGSFLSRFRLGVGALILAANLVVQQGILIEKTVEVTAPAAHVIIHVSVPTPVHVEAVTAPAPVFSAAALETGSDALDFFERASQARIGAELHSYTTQASSLIKAALAGAYHIWPGGIARVAGDAARNVTTACDHACCRRPRFLRTRQCVAPRLVQSRDCRIITGRRWRRTRSPEGRQTHCRAKASRGSVVQPQR